MRAHTGPSTLSGILLLLIVVPQLVALTCLVVLHIRRAAATSVPIEQQLVP